MPTQQGDLSLLDDPVAQQLLQSHIPARVSYVWTDGTPRVVPIGFHWNGQEVILGTFPDSPKMKAIGNGTKVALSIDSDTMPWKVLLIRGIAHTSVVEGVMPEYEAMSTKMIGEEQGRAWNEQMRAITPQMSRIAITPEWVGVIDFEGRFPNSLERAIELAQARAD